MAACGTSRIVRAARHSLDLAARATLLDRDSGASRRQFQLGLEPVVDAARPLDRRTGLLSNDLSLSPVRREPRQSSAYRAARPRRRHCTEPAARCRCAERDCPRQCVRQHGDHVRARVDAHASSPGGHSGGSRFWDLPVFFRSPPRALRSALRLGHAGVRVADPHRHPAPLEDRRDCRRVRAGRHRVYRVLLHCLSGAFRHDVCARIDGVDSCALPEEQQAPGLRRTRAYLVALALAALGLALWIAADRRNRSSGWRRAGIAAQAAEPALGDVGGMDRRRLVHVAVDCDVRSGGVRPASGSRRRVDRRGVRSRVPSPHRRSDAPRLAWRVRHAYLLLAKCTAWRGFVRPLYRASRSPTRAIAHSARVRGDADRLHRNSRVDRHPPGAPAVSPMDGRRLCPMRACGGSWPASSRCGRPDRF